VGWRVVCKVCLEPALQILRVSDLNSMSFCRELRGTLWSPTEWATRGFSKISIILLSFSSHSDLPYFISQHITSSSSGVFSFLFSFLGERKEREKNEGAQIKGRLLPIRGIDSNIPWVMAASHQWMFHKICHLVIIENTLSVYILKKKT